MTLNDEMPFGALVQQVFSLDVAIEWVAVEAAGREPRWAWRDPEFGIAYVSSSTVSPQIVDPLLLTLAEDPENAYGEDGRPHPLHLVFVVLAYSEMAQLVLRLGADAHMTVTVSARADTHVLGRKLVKLLSGYMLGSALDRAA